MKINIVCSDATWIYGRFVKEFRRYSKHEILLNQNNAECDMTHYLPYYEVPEHPKHPSTAWFSHQESRRDLKMKFVSAAQAVDHVISQSNKYKEMLVKECGITSATQIIPGVDLQAFNFRGAGRSLVGKEKLIIGYVGRYYSSTSRKNVELFKQVGKLPFVEVRVTGGKLPDEKIPDFYKGLDIVVSAAVLEGGPMCLQESLSIGVPFLCYSGVGLADEFSDVINRITWTGDYEKDSMAFIQFLKDVWEKKKIPFDDAIAMRRRASQYTWKKFVEEHDRVWEKLCAK